ncbi:MAG: hypothetical protein OEZ36_12230, partial [Spirochaetota bacterium]|nr:hypothetical protein [Spirochaetota bacterium]
SGCLKPGASKKSVKKLLEDIRSDKPIKRKQSIKIARENNIQALVPEINNIINNNEIPEMERYIAARALTDLLKAKVYPTMDKLLSSHEPIRQNCAIEILILCHINNYILIDAKTVGDKVTDIVKNTPSLYGKRIGAKLLGLIKYRPALPVIMSLIQSRKAVFDELIIALALLGDKKTNNTIYDVLLSLISDVRDKRLLRGIKKAEYILLNGNKDRKIFDSRLMDKLSDFSSENFIVSFEAEKYFRLFRQSKDYLIRYLGRGETYDHAKIKIIEKSRIPLLTLALKDRHPKIRYKAAKLLGELGDGSSCKAIKDFYVANMTSTKHSRIALQSLSSLNCPGILSMLEKASPEELSYNLLFKYFRKNPGIFRDNKGFIKKYPLIFSRPELFPRNNQLINELMRNPNRIVRLYAVYSLIQSQSPYKMILLTRQETREKDPELKKILRKIIAK